MKKTTKFPTIEALSEITEALGGQSLEEFQAQSWQDAYDLCQSDIDLALPDDTVKDLCELLDRE